MSFFCRLSRKHYWCTPHRSADGRLIQYCYECGSERPAREFHDDFATERLTLRLRSAKTDVSRIASDYMADVPHGVSEEEEPIAVGQRTARKFMLVK
jgi:hypothetical protein